jgi:hypothetical protein
VIGTHGANKTAGVKAGGRQRCFLETAIDELRWDAQDQDHADQQSPRQNMAENEDSF